jgi:short-subunit dehydrogenase
MEVIMQKQNGYALITGATGGLGQAFVKAYARRGVPLLLTGRSQEKLNALKVEIENKYENLPIIVYALDLTSEEKRLAFFKEIQEKGVVFSTLVNVAGADIQKGFEEYSQEKIAFQCRVNFESAVCMSKFALENKAETLDIINISSVSGLYPMPYFGIYSATKSALTSFSLALRQEVKKKGVRVTAVLPGAMPTRADIKEQIKGQGLWGKLAVKSPEWVAEYSIKAVKKNKAKTIPGFWNKAMRFFTAWIPLSWKIRFIAKRWSKISKDSF